MQVFLLIVSWMTHWDYLINKSLVSGQYGLSQGPKSKKQGNIPPINFDMWNIG
jgi:hypothetical protein